MEIAMKNYLKITICSKKATSSIEFGRLFLSAFIDSDIRLTPEYLDTMRDRSVNRPFINIDHSIEKWSPKSKLQVPGTYQEFYDKAKWTRKSTPSYQCYMLAHTIRNNFNKIVPSYFSFKAKWDDSVDWSVFFQRLCTVADAQAAMMHRFTPIELGNSNSRFKDLGIHTALNPKFPDISWAMMFGDDFVYAVNVDKLTAAGFPVEAVGSGYLVRVTDSILDISQRYEYFCERREILRSLLPIEIFVDEDEERRKRMEFMKVFAEYKASQGIDVKYEGE
jgi:hypothetical protein